MLSDTKSILLISMPFAGTAVPSIQLPILEGYLKERGIQVNTRHLYLKAAEFYKIQHYHNLINHPSNSYIAQLSYIPYVFPHHWENNKKRIIEYFNNKIIGHIKNQETFNFEYYTQQTDNFYNWVIESLDWQPFDFIGFTLNYGQLLPSLVIAKKIKELHPEKKVIFGGSRTIYPLGMKILETFDYIDFIVSGDGEEPLYLLSSDFDNYTSIPNLMYKDKNKAVWNEKQVTTDLQSLPPLSFDSFFEELSQTSRDVQQYFSLYGRLPIEISRGCWWNKCSFCNQCIIHPNYREKTVDQIVTELQILSEKYQILSFQLIGDTLLKNNYSQLCEKIKSLQKDYQLFGEARAGQLKQNDYQRLKEAGFNHIQTGIETFSSNYLKKINKGVRIIDNVAALKYSKECGIINSYNLIVNYPNEEKIDFEQTKKTIKYFKQFIDPPHLSPLNVEYGTTIFCNPREFNVKEFNHTQIDTLLFPKEILDKKIAWFYETENKRELTNNWQDLVKEWELDREQREIQAVKSNLIADKYVFYYLDGGIFLKIYDKRNN